MSISAWIFLASALRYPQIGSPCSLRTSAKAVKRDIGIAIYNKIEQQYQPAALAERLLIFPDAVCDFFTAQRRRTIFRDD